MQKDLSSISHPCDEQLLRESFRRYFPTLALTSCIPLAGDASNRRYYRLEFAHGEHSSLIVMQLSDPEGFKASEEAVSTSDSEVSELPFINVLKFLSSQSVSVPRLYEYDESGGFLYLEDFGDLTLGEAYTKSEPLVGEGLYAQAIDSLVQIHISTITPNSGSCLAFGRAFDVPLFMWEFEHFLEYGVVTRRGSPMSPDDHQVIQAEFQKIAEFIARQARVFTHRDYHSRNLMVDGARLGVIDFQDALMGPATYDLASLLRDSYIALDEHLINRMIDRYIAGMCEGLDHQRQKDLMLIDPLAFRRLFDLTSIQRNLKAAGRFVYIDRVKQNPKFLDDIPRTLSYVKQNLGKYPELEILKTRLAPYVPELQ